ncbi:MAG: translation initiation factor IF-3 [Candidatus Yanofskybacteria bacterium]|nr:translation initiation factor IF-3 [Candidatus Yanofskybacteria bacterium]
MAVRIFANHNIRASEVRVIDETGTQLGVMPLAQALKIAQERGLDLIQITEKVEPPITKLGQYGKFLYDKEKKERGAKKSTGGELKEVRMTFNISLHDMETRVKQAEKFLNKGDRVRVTLPLRGRQKGMEEYAREKLQAFLKSLEQLLPLRTEREIKREPRGLSMIIAKK